MKKIYECYYRAGIDTFNAQVTSVIRLASPPDGTYIGVCVRAYGLGDDWPERGSWPLALETSHRKLLILDASFWDWSGYPLALSESERIKGMVTYEGPAQQIGQGMCVTFRNGKPVDCWSTEQYAKTPAQAKALRAKMRAAVRLSNKYTGWLADGESIGWDE